MTAWLPDWRGLYRDWCRTAGALVVLAALGVFLLPPMGPVATTGLVERSEPVRIAALPSNDEVYPALDLGGFLLETGAREHWARLAAGDATLRGLEPAVVREYVLGVIPTTRLVVLAPEGTRDLACADFARRTACTPRLITAERAPHFLNRGEIALADPDNPVPKTRQELAAGRALARLSQDAVEEGAALRPAKPSGAEILAETQTTLAPSGGRAVVPMPELSQSGDAAIVRLQEPRAGSRTVRIVGVGDIMMGTNYPSASLLNPDIYEGVRADALLDRGMLSILRGADVTFGNLEGVLMDTRVPGKQCGNCFSFRSPTYYADILADAGFDVVALANNHSNDFGPQGRAETRAALRKAGIAYAGLPQSDARTATLVTETGVRVGVAAFSTHYSSLTVHDTATARSIVRGLKESHDIVVVSFHAGAEGVAYTRVPKRTETYFGENRGNVHAFSHAMVDAGADLVLGHGPHVPRAVEIKDGRLIAYSLGNFWTYTGMLSWGILGLGPMIDVSLDETGAVLAFTIHSTRQAGYGVPTLDPLEEARRFTFDRTRRDFPRTYARLSRAQPALMADIDGQSRRAALLEQPVVGAKAEGIALAHRLLAE